MPPRAVRHYLLAVQFFTRIPVTGRLAAWVGWSATAQQASIAHLPGVGWLVGLWGAAVLAGSAWVLAPSPWMPLAAAALATAATLWLTGGFHEDGLADTADGLGGSASPARALEMMKDSRLGGYGVMALVMALLLKTALVAMLAGVRPGLAAGVLCMVHVLSRMCALAVMQVLPYVGVQASSKTLTMTRQPPGMRALVVGLLWCLPALVWAAGWGWPLLLALLLAAGGATCAMVRWLHRRLGGMTGDTLGACQQVAEIACLLAACVTLAGHAAQ